MGVIVTIKSGVRRISFSSVLSGRPFILEGVLYFKFSNTTCGDANCIEVPTGVKRALPLATRVNLCDLDITATIVADE